MKSNLKTITYLLIFNFVLIIITMTYWQVVKREDFYTHPNNRRISDLEAITLLGKIVDRNGEVLAFSKKVADKYIRQYPGKKAVAHVVGYNSSEIGKAGLEQQMNAYLLGITGEDKLVPNMPGLKEEYIGYDVVTTIDFELQKLANRLIGTNKGAVVVLNPKTGEILCLLSKPTYDPNNIDEDWELIRQDNEDSPLLNRAVQGLYPPGSALKVVTGTGALTFDINNWDRVYDALGYINVKGHRIDDKNVKGKIDFVQAMEKSSNYVFATLGLEMGAEKFYKTLKDFGLTDKIELEIPTTKTIVTSPKDMNSEELAETAIGQGKLLVTPLHMALVAATIANNGEQVQPYLLKQVISSEGKVILENNDLLSTKVIDSRINSKIAEAMKQVVKTGTGQRASLPNIEIAGKTGTAENPHGKPHAWFIGYAPVDDPQVALAVIIENGGSGGKVAAPVARELFRQLLVKG